jgi:hypothetical protein
MELEALLAEAVTILDKESEDTGIGQGQQRPLRKRSM